MLDNDVVAHYRDLAEQTGRGYQTLINESLRVSADLQAAARMIVTSTLLDDSTVKLVHETSRQMADLQRQLDQSGVIAAAQAMANQRREVEELIGKQQAEFTSTIDKFQSLIAGSTIGNAISELDRSGAKAFADLSKVAMPTNDMLEHSRSRRELLEIVGNPANKFKP